MISTERTEDRRRLGGSWKAALGIAQLFAQGPQHWSSAPPHTQCWKGKNVILNDRCSTSRSALLLWVNSGFPQSTWPLFKCYHETWLVHKRVSKPFIWNITICMKWKKNIIYSMIKKSFLKNSYTIKKDKIMLCKLCKLWIWSLGCLESVQSQRCQKNCKSVLLTKIRCEKTHKHVIIKTEDKRTVTVIPFQSSFS